MRYSVFIVSYSLSFLLAIANIGIWKFTKIGILACLIEVGVDSRLILLNMASRKLRNAPAEMDGPTKLKTQLAITRRMIKEVQAYEKEVVVNEGKHMK